MNLKNRIDFILEIDQEVDYNDPGSWFSCKPEIKIEIRRNDIAIILWGDPIVKTISESDNYEYYSPKMLLNNYLGHYYFIISDKRTKEIIVGNSFLSILPIYYLEAGRKLICSNNALLLKDKFIKQKISKQFIAETILFNYPLFNHSIFDSISLLPSNSYLVFNNSKLSINKHTRIEELFSAFPSPWKGSVRHITELFLERVKSYLPDNPYACTLTGGFDGRTLVAAGLYHEKSFTGVCFGNNNSIDLEVAQKLAEISRMPFMSILLENGYIKKHSFDCGKEFIINSSGTSTFARAHYLHAARVLSSEFGCLITGNFGSEIFRAAHIPGVLISPNLYNLFNAPNSDEGFNRIIESKEYKVLHKDLAESVNDKLRNDIQDLPCFNSNYNGLTRNQKFYLYVFEEIFRKYFGAEMINQYGYLVNRTPFLDYFFLEQLLKTELAGVYSRLFELNPLKRYKGQVLYANIINLAYPLYGKIMTDKGYKPEDLINFTGKFNILKGYSRKVFGLRPKSVDPNGVLAAWKHNSSKWSAFSLPEGMLDSKCFTQPNSMDLIIKAESISFVVDYLNED